MQNTKHFFHAWIKLLFFPPLHYPRLAAWLRTPLQGVSAEFIDIDKVDVSQNTSHHRLHVAFSTLKGRLRWFGMLATRKLQVPASCHTESAALPLCCWEPHHHFGWHRWCHWIWRSLGKDRKYMEIWQLTHAIIVWKFNALQLYIPEAWVSHPNRSGWQLLLIVEVSLGRCCSSLQCVFKALGEEKCYAIKAQQVSVCVCMCFDALWLLKTPSIPFVQTCSEAWRFST